MPKLVKGRFLGRMRGDVGPSGVFIPSWAEISVLTIEELRELHTSYAARRCREPPLDHPDWLRKRQRRLETLIRQKQHSLEHKQRQR